MSGLLLHESVYFCVVCNLLHKGLSLHQLPNQCSSLSFYLLLEVITCNTHSFQLYAVKVNLHVLMG